MVDYSEVSVTLQEPLQLVSPECTGGALFDQTTSIEGESDYMSLDKNLKRHFDALGALIDDISKKLSSEDNSRSQVERKDTFIRLTSKDSSCSLSSSKMPIPKKLRHAHMRRSPRDILKLSPRFLQQTSKKRDAKYVAKKTRIKISYSKSPSLSMSNDKSKNGYVSFAGATPTGNFLRRDSQTYVPSPIRDDFRHKRCHHERSRSPSLDIPITKEEFYLNKDCSDPPGGYSQKYVPSPVRNDFRHKRCHRERSRSTSPELSTSPLRSLALLGSSRTAKGSLVLYE